MSKNDEINCMIENLERLGKERDKKLDDLKTSLLIQELDAEAYANGACRVGIRSKGQRRRRNFTFTINGKDYNGKDLPDPLWDALMKPDGRSRRNAQLWIPKNSKPKQRRMNDQTKDNTLRL